MTVTEDLGSSGLVYDPTAPNPVRYSVDGGPAGTGAAPAIVSAAIDALREYGIEHIEMPLQPERLWRALRDARRQASL